MQLTCFTQYASKFGQDKGQNIKDLREAEEIKKRWQEYTELYKYGLNDPDNHKGES